MSSYWQCIVTASADPGKLFFKGQVQRILRSLTRVDDDKVFQARKDGTSLKNPSFKFMTVEDLNKARERASKQLNIRLQMPPVVKINDDEVKVLTKDHCLKGLTSLNYVFTDISSGIADKNRIIVVRESNGTLRYANQGERSRINQVYFPIEGKEMTPPKMFYDPYLTVSA